MKITKFFALAFVALAFASCNKSTNVDNGGGGQEINTPTYATFKFNISDGTKAVADYDPSTTPEDDASNQKIGSLQMLIFNATTQALEFNEVVTGATKKTVLLTAGRKKIFFIANSQNLTSYTTAINPATFVPGNENSTLDKFYALNYSAGIPQGVVADKNATDRTFDIKPLHSDGGATSGLPMSNTNEITYVLKGGVSQSDAEGGEAKAEGNSDTNTFKIQLYYMIAKANLKLAPGVLNTADGKPVVQDVKFAIRNLARATNYVQNVPVAGQPQSYYYSTPFANKAAYDAQFDYASNISIPVSESASGYLYVPENNHSVLTRGQSSYFAIKARYEPVVISQVDYEVNTKVKYTHTKLALADPTNKNYIYTTNAVEGIPAGTYFATRELFAQAAWIMKNNKAYNSSFDTEAAALIKNSDFMAFTNAISYYRIDLGSGTGADTQYGVLRSNKYNATINKITGPGVPNEGDIVVEPENPVSSRTFIHATIVPASWQAITQSADL